MTAWPVVFGAFENSMRVLGAVAAVQPHALPKSDLVVEVGGFAGQMLHGLPAVEI